MNLEILRDRVSRVALFSRLGQQINVPDVQRIFSWEDWAGPEEPLVSEIHFRQQAFHDAIVSSDTEADWNAALNTIVKLAAPLVPYDSHEDAWYGPNMAVWHAAWSFSLEAMYVSASHSLPAELKAQIYWFELGHWPCCLRDMDTSDDIDGYIVY